MFHKIRGGSPAGNHQNETFPSGASEERLGFFAYTILSSEVEVEILTCYCRLRDFMATSGYIQCESKPTTIGFSIKEMVRSIE